MGTPRLRLVALGALRLEDLHPWAMAGSGTSLHAAMVPGRVLATFEGPRLFLPPAVGYECESPPRKVCDQVIGVSWSGSCSTGIG